MMAMQLSEAAGVLQARRSGPDARFAGISTDSRSLAAGNLFFALSGPHFDGHDHLDAARSRGAVAAVVSRPVQTPLPLLQVADTRRALGELARHWRGRFSLPVVGITGSNGKTTVKEMVAAILGQRGSVLATQGNLNNDIGVPLTLARLDQAHRSAVVEMGANHAGEIAYLTRLARPTVGIVTNAGPAHLEGFGSLEGVAHAKGELFAELSSDAVAVINADDRFAGLWRGLAQGRRCLGFGLEPGAEVSADWQANGSGTRLNLRTPDGELPVRLPLPGRHNVLNALGATAAALAAGASLEDVRRGLEGLAAVGGRLQHRTRADGGLIIDDTYNANPASLRAAIAVLAALPGERWLVLGDMAELGGDAAALHAEIGADACAAGIERLYTLGPLSAHAARACGERAQAFVDFDALMAALRKHLRAEVTLLVKGSRAMGMERVVRALTAPVSGEASC
ncbi:MAG: UDP-N-acetylmuramoyl-tripeptide--D-alanyl-D-alanine ligase [Gammaproteobacteria bacterium]